jgi:hypothetical protein
VRYNINKLRETNTTKKGSKTMKKYDVEMRTDNTQDFDNWVGDYTVAETEEEAIELVKAWLIENGYKEDVDDLEYQVTEYEA